jgi:type II secretory pathway pseudopilin PulG
MYNYLSGIDEICTRMSSQIKVNSFKQFGFTLIEVLVTGASASVILGASIYGLTRADQLSKLADEKMVIEANFQKAMEYIASDLLETRTITLDASLIPPEVRHPRRSRWLDECDRPKGGRFTQGAFT